MFLIYCGRLYPPCDFHTFPLYTERHLFSQTLCRARAISLIVSEAFSIVRRLSSLKSNVWLVSFLEVVAIISPIIWFCLWGIPILWFLYGLFSSLYPFWLLLTWSKFLKLGFFYFWTCTKFVGILISLTFGIFHTFQEGWNFFSLSCVALEETKFLGVCLLTSVILYVSNLLAFFLAFPISSPGILWFILCWGFFKNLFHSR